MRINAGIWWKYETYEIRPRLYRDENGKKRELPSGYIVPAQGAKLEKYDPWQAWNRNRPSRQDVSTPYSELFSMPNPWEENKIFLKLTEEGERAILDWCGRYGVLGVLPYRAVEIRLAPRRARHLREEIPLAPKGSRTMLTTMQPRYAKIATGWRGWSETQFGGVVEREFPGAGVLLDDEPGGDNPPTWHELGEIMQYFPDLTNPSDIPLPLSDKFWKQYAEPVSSFFGAARTLTNATMAARARKMPPIERDRHLLATNLGELQSLLSHLRMGVTWAHRRGFNILWTSDSLLSTLAAMIAEDIQAAGRPLKCLEPNCQKLFFSFGYQTRFCSKRCRWRHGQRQHRKQHKGAEQETP